MDPYSQERPDDASPTFRLGRIPVTVQPGFLVITALLGLSRSLAEMATWVCVCFVSVLVHELGHAWAIGRFGGQPSILLYSGGGLTFGDTSETPWRSILVSLAGPAAGFTFAGLALALQQLTPGASGALADVYRQIFQANVVWGLVNLVPMLPLDGGHAFESLVALRWPARARFVAEVATCITSLAVVAAGLVVRWYWPAVLAVMWTAPSWRALFARLEQHRDRAVLVRLDELAMTRRNGRTRDALELARALLAAARTRTYRRAVAAELVLCQLDARNLSAASELIQQHFQGVEVPQASWLAHALVQHGARREVERLEREAAMSDDVDVVGVFLDACAELEDHERAIAFIREHHEPRATSPALFSRAAVHFHQQRYEQALILCEVGTLVHPQSGVFPYNAACCLAQLGRHDEAFVALERAFEAADGTLTDMESDPDLASLRGDARWPGLSARASLPSLVPGAAQAV